MNSPAALLDFFVALRPVILVIFSTKSQYPNYVDVGTAIKVNKSQKTNFGFEPHFVEKVKSNPFQAVLNVIIS